MQNYPPVLFKIAALRSQGGVAEMVQDVLLIP